MGVGNYTLALSPISTPSTHTHTPFFSGRFALAKEVRMAAGSPEAAQYAELDLAGVEARLKALQATIPSESLVCFCHNDILFKITVNCLG